MHLVDDQPAARAAQRQREVEHLPHGMTNDWPDPHSRLVAAPPPPHKRRVAADLFDQQQLALRRARALRQGPEQFLHDRAFEDILERLAFVQRPFGRALLIGSLDLAWRDRLSRIAGEVTVIEAAELATLEPGTYDLCVAVGALDTVADLPTALLTLRFALRDDSLLIGALPGGDTLPTLRSAMRAADERMGAATPHVHPRIEPAGLTSLLGSAGFSMPVVDVDRVSVSYKSFADLVRDLRAMGATNVLKARSRRPLTRAAARAAAVEFMANSEEDRATEIFELLHFAAWTPASPAHG